MQSIEIDIVIIGRNEGELLTRAIESCLKAADEFIRMGQPKPKIIYIDGQSNDNSMDTAKKYGIICDVVIGKPNPALGRHTGFKYCLGKYVFFLDGDMELKPGWLWSASQYLEDHLSIAGVAGYCDWEVYQGGKVTKIPNHSGIQYHGQRVTNDVGGGFMYRSEVLREVGDFDPTMIRVGELEMYLRILARGFNLVYLAVPMAIHRDMKGSMGRNFLRGSIITKNIFIPGVIARKAPKSWRVIFFIFRQYWLYIWNTLSMAGIFFSAYKGMTGSSREIWFSLVATGMIQLFGAHWLFKNKKIKRAIVSLITINLYVPAFLFGYLFCWPNIGGFYKTKDTTDGL